MTQWNNDTLQSTKELRIEMERKDMLIKKHQERLQKWQGMMSSLSRGQGGQGQATQGQMNPQQAQTLGQILQTSSATHHQCTETNLLHL